MSNYKPRSNTIDSLSVPQDKELSYKNFCSNLKSNKIPKGRCIVYLWEEYLEGFNNEQWKLLAKEIGV